MQRTNLIPLSVTLLVVALAACGSNDTPSAAKTPTTSKTDAPAATPPKPDPTPPAKPAETTALTTPEKTDKAPVEASAPKTDEAPASTTDRPPSTDPAVAAIDAFIASKKIDKTAKNWKTTVPMPPKATFDPARKYFWVLNTTEGPIKIRLMTEVAPMHASSTIYLTQLGFYDDITFHRVIPGFMAQGGDPLGTGTGGPAYKYDGEFSPKASHSKPGILSMANAGAGTDGSQFFLTFSPQERLDGKHTVFGEVVEGMDNVKKLEKFGTQGGATTKPLKIQTAKIVVE